jgi:hypothetical protein
MDDQTWIPVPKGPNRLRQLLENAGEPVEKLTSHPIFLEGYDAGKAEATKNYKKMMAAMATIYQLDVEE